jgi:hypothetical protein
MGSFHPPAVRLAVAERDLEGYDAAIDKLEAAIESAVVPAERARYERRLDETIARRQETAERADQARAELEAA